MLVADWNVKFSPCSVASFLALGLLACILFSEPKTNSPPILYVQSLLVSLGFAPWLSGWAGGLAVQYFLILSNFSACPGAELKIGCQSSVKESASKKLVQRVLVLLLQIVQYEGVSPLQWTWTWRTQRRSHGWYIGWWMLSVGMWVDCCRLWSVVCGRVPNFGSGISLSGELVLEFNYFKKFQVFKILNPVGSRQKV